MEVEVELESRKPLEAAYLTYPGLIGWEDLGVIQTGLLLLILNVGAGKARNYSVVRFPTHENQ